MLVSKYDGMTSNSLNSTEFKVSNYMTSSQQIPNQAAEKPAHYSYLKGFRVDQCALFLQHKCTQHRPYTCFYWHFKNQRRRMPVRRSDGTFNYNPDIYCEQYDEQTGSCPNSDDCSFVHRNAGDTEKRYHLRYYKTAVCIHEKDVNGCCSKNGGHCASAHGQTDIRPHVYDLKEFQLVYFNNSKSETNHKEASASSSTKNTSPTSSGPSFSPEGVMNENSNVLNKEIFNSNERVIIKYFLRLIMSIVQFF
jgi:hypothetical protein